MSGDIQIIDRNKIEAEIYVGNSPEKLIIRGYKADGSGLHDVDMSAAEVLMLMVGIVKKPGGEIRFNGCQGFARAIR